MQVILKQTHKKTLKQLLRIKSVLIRKEIQKPLKQLLTKLLKQYAISSTTVKIIT